MKKIYPFIFATLISLNLIAQVPETHMALVNPKTATWCEPCGEWGVISTAVMTDESLDKAVFIELHNSDDLSNPFNNEILDNYEYLEYTPAWYVNGVNATYHTDMGQVIVYTEANVKDAVDSTYEVPPIVNSSFTFNLSGDLLTVETDTKFFQDANGEYYLAMYVVEDDVDEDQDGAAADYRHDFTLRTGMTATNTYGELIAEGAIASGSTYSKSYSVTLDPEWIHSHIWIAAVIWEKIGTDYFYVNANADYERIAVGINDNAIVQLGTSLLTNPVVDKAELQLNSDVYLDDVVISLTDINGKNIKKIFNGSLLQGQTAIDIDVHELPAGLYLVKTIANNNQFTNKLVVVK